MGRVLLILAAILPAAGPVIAREPQAMTLDTLLDGFRQMPGLEARFREEKRIAVLVVPLVSEGTLHFARPARLVRHTLAPERWSMLIDGPTLIFGDGNTREEVDLEANPVVRDYVNSFLLILVGDRVALVMGWRMEISVHAESWEMTLQPMSEPIKKTIREMTLRGKGAVIQWVKLVETTGDETVTLFSDINPSRRYSQAEIDRTFRIPPG